MESQGKIELPRAFEHADIDHLVVLIADMLDRLIEHNDKIPLSPEALTRFHSRTPPTISVLDYLRRIVKYANVERTCLLITLHYIDQICARLPHFTLSSLTCHRFIITAVVVASKALCDAFCTNAHYAKVGGIRVGELNVLEKELLNAIDWRLTSTREVLDAYYVNLIRTHSKGAYTLAAETTSPALTDVDSDMDSLLSASPSPTFVPATLEDEKAAMQLQPQLVMANGVPSAMNGVVGRGARCLSAEPQPIEPSAVLINCATLSPKPCRGPTIEQNMAFEALRQQASTCATSSSSLAAKKMSSSAPASAASCAIAMAGGVDISTKSLPLPGPGVIIPEQNGPLTHPRSSGSVAQHNFSPGSQPQLHIRSNQSSPHSTISSTLHMVPPELLSPPPAPTSPRVLRGLRSPNKRGVEASYARDVYADPHVTISSKKENLDSQFNNTIEGVSGTRSPMHASDPNLMGNKLLETYVDIDADVNVDDIDCMRPRTRMRIDYEGQSVG